ncbi:MAG: hypothetical protein ACRDIB_05680, partial [Ardenticatenaceae bacterium]
AATLITLWVVAVIFFRLNRIWLPYYLIGAVGMAFVIIFAGGATALQTLMESGVAASTYGMASAIGIPAKLFEADPGALMIFVVGQAVGHDNGWTMVRVTIECSGLLETGVLTGMVGFYPGWSLKKRAVFLLLGIVAVYAANIIRLTVIMGTLHWFGKDALFIAHTIIGRAVFFVLVIAIFWYIVTRPTMRDVARKLRQEMAS